MSLRQTRGSPLSGTPAGQASFKIQALDRKPKQNLLNDLTLRDGAGPICRQEDSRSALSTSATNAADSKPVTTSLRQLPPVGSGKSGF
jgi:hypothetical protein